MTSLQRVTVWGGLRTPRAHAGRQPRLDEPSRELAGLRSRCGGGHPGGLRCAAASLKPPQSGLGLDVRAKFGEQPGPYRLFCHVLQGLAHREKLRIRPHADCYLLLTGHD
jgi:hypothetical protein